MNGLVGGAAAGGIIGALTTPGCYVLKRLGVALPPTGAIVLAWTQFGTLSGGFYGGGIELLSRWRGRSDELNPAAVGGLMGSVWSWHRSVTKARVYVLYVAAAAACYTLVWRVQHVDSLPPSEQDSRIAAQAAGKSAASYPRSDELTDPWASNNRAQQ
eukprot:310059-Prymnesium_polylepis.1